MKGKVVAGIISAIKAGDSFTTDLQEKAGAGAT